MLKPYGRKMNDSLVGEITLAVLLLESTRLGACDTRLTRSKYTMTQSVIKLKDNIFNKFKKSI